MRRKRPRRTPARRTLRRDAGSQLVELAVTLPFLVVMVVGIFDFGGAYNLKQKLSGITREAARYAADSPTNDLTSGGTPQSVQGIRNLVDDDLTAAGINDCSLRTVGGAAAGNLSWTFAANGTCPGTLTLTVQRSYDFVANGTGASAPVHVISTQITLSYPYKWEFGNVVGLIAPGANYAKGVTQISTFSIVPNMD
jgi:Flp pilus assembly protein TadG